MKQTLPSLALINEESPHFGSEKEGGELFKGKLVEHHFTFHPKPQESIEFSSLTSAALDPSSYEMNL